MDRFSFILKFWRLFDNTFDFLKRSLCFVRVQIIFFSSFEFLRRYTPVKNHGKHSKNPGN